MTSAWPMPTSKTQRGAACNWLAATCGGNKAELCETLGNVACAPTPFCAAHVHMPGHLQDGAGLCYHPYGKTQDILYQCIPTELGENATKLALEMSGEMGSQPTTLTRAWEKVSQASPAIG